MSRIVSCASYAPSNVVTNDDLSKMVETNDEWIVQRTGIKRRHILDNETNGDMAYQAAKKAIEKSGLNKEEIDAILFATVTPEQLFPSMACSLKKRLGIEKKEVLAFDLSAACSGFVVALECAHHLSKSYKNILIVASEAMSKIIDWQDRSTCVLFGDGAGAIVLTRSMDEHTFHSYTEHDINDSLVTNTIYDEKIKVSMKGNEVFRFAVRALEKCIRKECEEANCTIDEIDYIVAHQANQRILQFVARQLGIPEEKFYKNLDEYGNTSSASIPLALSEMIEKKLIQPNQKICMVAFGAGLTYSSCLWKVEGEIK